MSAGPSDGDKAPFPNIAAEYGRTMEVWEELVRESGIEGARELAAWLESEHEVTHEHAVALAEYFTASARKLSDTSS